ncbi:hypothetical protein D3C73_1434140 [compost metagenome]
MTGSPIVCPSPLITLITPGGKPTCTARWASTSDDKGVSSEGLIRTALPVARAGAMFHAARYRGEFHGMMANTTPSGSRSV